MLVEVSITNPVAFYVLMGMGLFFIVWGVIDIVKSHRKAKQKISNKLPSEVPSH
jgi:hypothetical protein